MGAKPTLKVKRYTKKLGAGRVGKMDFELSAEDKRFREIVRHFLAEELPEDLSQAAARYAGVWAPFDVAMQWHRILDRHGYAVPNWPVEYGGRDWSVVQQYLWQSEYALAGAPRVPAMGPKMCAPVLMKFGTETQKAELIPRIRSGEDFWCQGYSEPGAGSDLAALQCKAVRDGDHYVLNGTKIWTTYAQYANWMFCLVRTGNSGKPQAGISFLLVEMDSPGLTVSPIVSISGDHEVNQVFFDDVRVPAVNLVGDENEGWTVAKYLLQHERGGAYASGIRRQLARFREVANTVIQEHQAPDLSAVLARLSALEIEAEAVDMTERRIISRISAGVTGDSEPSMLKLAGSELRQKVDELWLDLLAHYIAPDYLMAREGRSNWAPGPDYAIPVVGSYLNNRAGTIYGGSSEVQRNIIAKLGLGL